MKLKSKYNKFVAEMKSDGFNSALSKTTKLAD